MTSDPGARERRRRPRLDLPAVVSVEARPVAFEPPRRRNFSSQLPALESTVEFLVETEAPLPVRALGPVVYVGDTPVTEVYVEDDTHYRFVALRPDELREGQPITLGWSGAPAEERVETGRRFEGGRDDPRTSSDAERS
ncbi:hypothetical protein [Oerskovia jenensis]|uniref:hypothetical protein n=1 Tax=Oerskovia jenensis TaxID=162169 RepID=UPI0036DC877E